MIKPGKWFGPGKWKPSGHWQIALAAGLFLHLLAFATLRVVTRSSPEVSFPQPFIKFPQDLIETGGDSANVSYGDLFDPAPLFLPTLWNYAPDFGNLHLDREVEPIFEPFEPVISLSAQPPAILAEEIRPRYNLPRNLLESERSNHFSVFGKRRRAIVKAPQRAGFMEVQRAGGESLSIGSVLPDGLAEVTQDMLSLVVFQIIVDKSGPVGEPLILKGSGSPRTDQALRVYLATAFLLSGLKPGYYTVTFGP